MRFDKEVIRSLQRAEDSIDWSVMASPSSKPLTHEQRQQLLQQPIRFQVIGGRSWGGRCMEKQMAHLPKDERDDLGWICYPQSWRFHVHPADLTLYF